MGEEGWQGGGEEREWERRGGMQGGGEGREWERRGGRVGVRGENGRGGAGGWG